MPVHLCLDGLGTVELELVLFSFHPTRTNTCITGAFSVPTSAISNMHTCELTPFATPCVVLPT